MPERAPFLSTTFSAYHHRERPADEEELTRVGPGTPCGEYLRRFWQPVILSDELRDLPSRVRIIGEDLVAFRDRGGAAGLLELHCPHRGTPTRGSAAATMAGCSTSTAGSLRPPGNPPTA